MDCVYIGDSIAVGLHQLDHQCEVRAKIGANSDFITRHFSNAKNKSYVIVSMGSNGPHNKNNLENARKLRRSITADFVIWILPYDRTAAAAIKSVAIQFQDGYVDLKPYKSKDGLHPAYKPVAKQIQSSLDTFYD